VKGHGAIHYGTRSDFELARLSLEHWSADQVLHMQLADQVGQHALEVIQIHMQRADWEIGTTGQF
jgi:hypothetical protein